MYDKEAIDKTIEQLDRISHSIGSLGETSDYTEVAITALGLQMPKKPIYEGDGYYDGELVYDTWRCPNCNEAYEVDYDDYKYCPNCGQRLEKREYIRKGGVI